jgi:hypothetical protein
MRPTRTFRRLPALLALCVVVLAPTFAYGHAERPTLSPARPGSVPNAARIARQSPVLDVCKSKLGGRWECRYRHIQQAVTAAPNGALIRIWPGLYREEPSRAVPEGKPDNPDGTFSFEYHKKNPNAENLVAIVGKKNITLLGMGRRPKDVVIDAGFEKHVVVRGDRANGLIIKNLSVWHGFDHGIYVLETSGLLIDRVVSGYSREYAYLTFANDHVLMDHCEATGSGDGGLYPGSSADTPGRVSTEIRNCKSHHNVLGYSGTQGDHVWVHDNEFYDNAVGLVTDSETDHPNYPQNNLVLENNRFHDNNFNVYSEESDLKATVFEGSILIPVGVGVLLASGNDNLLQHNQIWGHERFGVWFLNGAGIVLGPTGEPFAPPFFSSNNRFIANRMHPPAGVRGEQNAVDFGWDGLGLNNCWSDNVRDADGTPANTDAAMLPPCTTPILSAAVPHGIPNPMNFYEQAALVYAEGAPICWTLNIGRCVWGPGPPAENARNLPEGMRIEWPKPPVCGPVTCRTVLGR